MSWHGRFESGLGRLPYLLVPLFRCSISIVSPDCASVLQKTLDEERATDKKLTTLAESKINLRAASCSPTENRDKDVAREAARRFASGVSLRDFQALRSAKCAPQNAIAAPRHSAARPASTPEIVGIGLGAEAA